MCLGAISYPSGRAIHANHSATFSDLISKIFRNMCMSHIHTGTFPAGSQRNLLAFLSFTEATFCLGSYAVGLSHNLR